MRMLRLLLVAAFLVSLTCGLLGCGKNAATNNNVPERTMKVDPPTNLHPEDAAPQPNSTTNSTK